MKENNLSYEKLGKEINVSPSAVREWKRGSFPSIDSLNKIAIYFDISIDYLLGLSQDTELKPCSERVDFLYRYDILLRQSHLRDVNIAKLLGTNTSTIAGWRKGKIPTLTTLIKLCKIFDCSFGYLAGISDF